MAVPHIIPPSGRKLLLRYLSREQDQFRHSTACTFTGSLEALSGTSPRCANFNPLPMHSSATTFEIKISLGAACAQSRAASCTGSRRCSCCDRPVRPRSRRCAPSAADNQVLGEQLTLHPRRARHRRHCGNEETMIPSPVCFTSQSLSSARAPSTISSCWCSTPSHRHPRTAA